MPEDLAHSPGDASSRGSSGPINWVKEHPVGAGAIAVGIVLVIWWMSSGSSGGATAAPDTSTAAAAQIQAAQIAANAQNAQLQTQATTQTTLASIAAGVTNNQTAAAEAVALDASQKQLQAVTLATTSAQNIATTQATAAQNVAHYQAVSNEYSSLAGALAAFGITSSANAAQVQAINVGGAVSAAGSSNQATAQGGVAALIASLGGKVQGWTGMQNFVNSEGVTGADTSGNGMYNTNNYAQKANSAFNISGQAQNPNLAASNATFLTGFQSLLTKFSPS